MPPSTTTTLLSPAELSYLHTSLSLTPPVRPDGRTATQFRPLVAETDILPATNGSARICFADGTEAIVGVKAEVEKTTSRAPAQPAPNTQEEDTEMADPDASQKSPSPRGHGSKSWVEMSIEIPGYRDDDALPVFLAAMLNEGLTATGDLADKLYINARFHWRLYLDILLLSAPLSYPVPLLSLTTHLALLSTHFPRLISEGDEDPLFDDDWDAAPALYPSDAQLRPPITLLVVAVGENIVFDPSKEEIAVADTILAISVGVATEEAEGKRKGKELGEKRGDGGKLSLLGIRVVDPPARSAGAGVEDQANSATGGGKSAEKGADGEGKEEVWRPPRGGFKRRVLMKAIGMSLGEKGVGEEVLAGLEAVKVGC
ncbi:MAG: hypothetical protein MMC23_005104 [Stictis urceolatum]|nr:hypothetical protein [Stictis urceolata]